MHDSFVDKLFTTFARVKELKEESEKEKKDVEKEVPVEITKDTAELPSPEIPTEIEHTCPDCGEEMELIPDYKYVCPSCGYAVPYEDAEEEIPEEPSVAPAVADKKTTDEEEPEGAEKPEKVSLKVDIKTDDEEEGEPVKVTVSGEK